MTRALTKPGLLLALALLTAVAVLVPRPAFGMACRSYGCGCCGHPSNPPWHYSGCRYYRGSSSSSGSSGGYGGGAAAGNAFGAMVDGFSREIQKAQEERARAARLAAERRRRAEIARRQRLEQLRRERIRRARQMRVDWDRREVEMGERLTGVFDPVPSGPSTSFFGIGGAQEPDIYVDSSIVDLRPEPGEQRALEGQLRMNPAFLQAQAQRAAATDAFATANYGAVPIASLPTPRRIKPFKERLKALVGVMADDVLGESLKSLGPYGRAAEGAKKIYDVGTGAARSILPKALDPQTYQKLASPRFHDFGEEQAELGRAGLGVLRSATGDESLKHETYYRKFRALVFGSEGR